jgi:hypothetical protein
MADERFTVFFQRQPGDVKKGVSLVDMFLDLGFHHDTFVTYPLFS